MEEAPYIAKERLCRLLFQIVMHHLFGFQILIVFGTFSNGVKVGEKACENCKDNHKEEK